MTPQYYIGMHGDFDSKKYQRDYRHDFWGIEFCSFESEAAIEGLKTRSYAMGIHFPLNKSHYKYRDPLILSLDPHEVDLAFEAIQRELAQAQTLDASYLLMHFPKPFVIDKDLDWQRCAFKDHEWVGQDAYPYPIFKDKCYKAFDDLSKLSKAYGIDIILEVEMLNPYLYKGDLLKSLLEAHPDIGLCLDTSRLHVLSQVDKAFHWQTFVREMAPYTRHLHISNIKVQDTISLGHHPAILDLNTEEGWFDIPRFLDIFTRENRSVSVLFEHQSSRIDDKALQACYAGVMEYFTRKAEAREPRDKGGRYAR